MILLIWATSFSSSYEVSEDQVLASLETIFGVRIPGSCNAPDQISSHLEIFDPAESLTEPRHENGGIDYPELISEIISQVLVNISQGIQSLYIFTFCQW